RPGRAAVAARGGRRGDAARADPGRVPGPSVSGAGGGVVNAAFGRRTVLRGAVGLAALGGLVGIADLARVAVADPADSHTGLRVGYLPITDAAPLLVAHGAGLYDPA